MSSNSRVTLTNEADDSKASITDRGFKGALAVELLDANGNQITDFGGEGTIASSTGGGKVTVNLIPVEITFTGTTKAIKIEAHYDNTGYVFYGASDVKGDGENAYGMLVAGDSIAVDFNDASEALYVIADTANQIIFKMKLS